MTDFGTFWQHYPRRKTTPAIMGRLAAQQKANRIVKSGMATWEELIEGARKYAQCDLVDEGFVCMPITWLNQGRWLDEYETAASVHEQAFDEAAKTPPQSRAHDDWGLLWGKPSDFTRQRLLNDWNYPRDGAAPGEPNCLVPAEILREYGFIKAVGE